MRVISSLQKTLEIDRILDKDLIKLKLDEELASIASKEYDPSQLQFRNIGIRSPAKATNMGPALAGSHLEPMTLPTTSKQSFAPPNVEMTTHAAIMSGRN